MWCAANAKSYVSGDNSSVVATDSVKNACLLAAKSLAQPASCEDFAVAVATDLVARYPGMHTRCVVQVSEVPWVRVAEGGTPHEHGFVRCTAGGERFCEADARAEHGTRKFDALQNAHDVRLTACRGVLDPPVGADSGCFLESCPNDLEISH